MSTTDMSALAARIEELFELPTSDLDEVRVATPTDRGWNVN